MTDYKPTMLDATKLIDREGWYCAKCGHRHAGRTLANICVGCPCSETSPTTAEDDWIRIASQNAKDATARLNAAVKDGKLRAVWALKHLLRDYKHAAENDSEWFWVDQVEDRMKALEALDGPASGAPAAVDERSTERATAESTGVYPTAIHYDQRCDGRYPVPQTSPPRDEPFDVTYRCARPEGHDGPHGT